MGAKYTEAQKRASYKYNEGKITIRLTVPIEQADKYKARAQAQGKSLTRYILDIVDQYGEGRG